MHQRGLRAAGHVQPHLGVPMMIFDEKNGFGTEDAVIALTVGCGPCCEGKFNLMVMAQRKVAKRIEDLKVASASMTRADLIKLKTVIDALLDKSK